VGFYLNSNDSLHSLLAIFDSDLKVLKMIDYSNDSGGDLGGFDGVTFDGKGYAYVLGILGIAKFSLDGELIAVNKDVATFKVLYGYDYLYAFGVGKIGGALVLYVLDTDLRPGHGIRVKQHNLGHSYW